MIPVVLDRVAKILGGIPVFEAYAGSVAESAGLRYGDIILAINGRATPNVSEYCRAKSTSRDRMFVTYFRCGRTRHVMIATAPRPKPPEEVPILQNFVQTRAAALLEALQQRRLN